MKIVCPACEATYEVPERVATSQRKMRCARCGSEWVPADALVAAAAPAIPPVAPASAPASVAPPAMPMPVDTVPAHDFDEAPAAGVTAPVPEPEPATHEPAMAPAMADPVEAEADLEPAMDLPLTAMVVVPPRPMTIRPGSDVAREQLGLATNFIQRGVPPPEATGAPILAWGGSVAVLALAVGAALVFRAPVMKVWPPSTRLYAAIGLVQP